MGSCWQQKRDEGIGSAKAGGSALRAMHGRALPGVAVAAEQPACIKLSICAETFPHRNPELMVNTRQLNSGS